MPNQEQQAITCRVPPPLTEDQISDLLDGEINQDVMSHLEQCPGCTQRVERARMTEQRLKQRLYRFDCPSSQRLSEYHLDLMPPETRSAITLHLEHCPHCRSELEALAVFLDQDAAVRSEPVRSEPVPKPAAPKLRLGDLLAILVPQTSQLALRGAPDASTPILRGPSSGPLMFEVAGITIFIEMDQPHKPHNEFFITGQFLAETGLWQGALVQVWQNEVIRAVTTIDEMGQFSCGPLNLGIIDVRITAEGGSVLMIQSIRLQE